MIGTGGSFICVFSFAHHFKALLASEVVFVKMPSRQQKTKAKRREEYLLNRDYELESSRVRYDADAEQRQASARDMYRAIWSRTELLRGGDMNRILTRFELLEKRLKIQANRETNRASQRRNSSAARSAKRAQRKRKREAESQTARYNGNTTTAKR